LSPIFTSATKTTIALYFVDSTVGALFSVLFVCFEKVLPVYNAISKNYKIILNNIKKYFLKASLH